MNKPSSMVIFHWPCAPSLNRQSFHCGSMPLPSATACMPAMAFGSLRWPLTEGKFGAKLWWIVMVLPGKFWWISVASMFCFVVIVNSDEFAMVLPCFTCFTWWCFSVSPSTEVNISSCSFCEIVPSSGRKWLLHCRWRVGGSDENGDW